MPPFTVDFSKYLKPFHCIAKNRLMSTMRRLHLILFLIRRDQATINSFFQDPDKLFCCEPGYPAWSAHLVALHVAPAVHGR